MILIKPLNGPEYFDVNEPDLRFDEDVQNDITRIVQVFEKHGYRLNRLLASYLWKTYSHDVCACWLILPETDEKLWETLKPYWKDFNKLKVE